MVRGQFHRFFGDGKGDLALVAHLRVFQDFLHALVVLATETLGARMDVLQSDLVIQAGGERSQRANGGECDDAGDDEPKLERKAKHG